MTNNGWYAIKRNQTSFSFAMFNARTLNQFPEITPSEAEQKIDVIYVQEYKYYYSE